MTFAAIECEKGQCAPRHEEEDVCDARRGSREKGVIREAALIVTVHERDYLGDCKPLTKIGAAG